MPCFNIVDSKEKKDRYGVHFIVGVCVIQRSIRNGVRESTSTAYLRPVSCKRNLIVITEALVEKVKAHVVEYFKFVSNINY